MADGIENAKNSLHNLEQAYFALQREYYVILFEAGPLAADLLEQVMDKCVSRMDELNAEIQLGGSNE